MNDTKYYHGTAFGFLLLLLLAGSLLVQTAGYWCGASLSQYSLYIVMLPALLLTYGYCFPLTMRHIKTIVVLGLLLALLGMLSAHMLDFTADGLGYQQASVQAIMEGWNPFGPDAIMLWQQLYPSGLWSVEASLAWLYGSVEAAKMYHVWLLFVAVPLLLFSLSLYKGCLNRLQVALVVLMIVSVTLLAQLLTHYVDADAYLAGVIFIGGVLLYGRSRRYNVISAIIMASGLCLVVSAKLSGLYHAIMLCTGAVLFLWWRAKKLPWKVVLLLLVAGIVSVAVVGYRPYVTSFIAYGPSLFPPDKVAYGPQPAPKRHWFMSSSNTENFSAEQRPSSFDDLIPPQRFLYSLFSVDGGAPHQPAQLKWPWTIGPWEWKFAGDPDPRTGGNGPLFALGCVVSLLVFACAVLSRRCIDNGLMLLALTCLIFSMIFPQSWWARYVPFAYLVPFLLLLAIGSHDKVIRAGMLLAIIVFGVNAGMAASSAYALYDKSEKRFADVVVALKDKPAGSIYLVPPVFNYKRYNGAYLPLQRRLKAQGIDTRIEIAGECPRMEEMYSEFAICY